MILRIYSDRKESVEAFESIAELIVEETIADEMSVPESQESNEESTEPKNLPLTRNMNLYMNGHGNVVETTTTVTKVYLYIAVTHKSADEMANHYGFNKAQRAQLSELLSDDNRSMWDGVLAGIT